MYIMKYCRQNAYYRIRNTLWVTNYYTYEYSRFVLIHKCISSEFKYKQNVAVIYIIWNNIWSKRKLWQRLLNWTNSFVCTTDFKYFFNILVLGTKLCFFGIEKKLWFWKWFNLFLIWHFIVNIRIVKCLK